MMHPDFQEFVVKLLALGIVVVCLHNVLKALFSQSHF